MKRLLLFSCRQSIHQLGLPNLALNEQRNPWVCAMQAQQILAALFPFHMSCSWCLAFANNKATNRRCAFIKTGGRNSPRPFLWLPSSVAGTTWLHLPEERKRMYDNGAAEQNTFLSVINFNTSADVATVAYRGQSLCNPSLTYFLSNLHSVEAENGLLDWQGSTLQLQGRFSENRERRGSWKDPTL